MSKKDIIKTLIELTNITVDDIKNIIKKDVKIVYRKFDEEEFKVGILKEGKSCRDFME